MQSASIIGSAGEPRIVQPLSCAIENALLFCPIMDDRTAKVLFEQAEDRYREGLYEDSLALIEQIETGFSRKKDRVLYAKAKLYWKLNRLDAAIEICAQLLKDFDHPRAGVLMDRILESHRRKPTPV